MQILNTFFREWKYFFDDTAPMVLCLFHMGLMEEISVWYLDVCSNSIYVNLVSQQRYCNMCVCGSFTFFIIPL